MEEPLVRQVCRASCWVQWLKSRQAPQIILHDHALKEEAMLVLSRKIGETISIGENVTVKVVRTQGGRVQIAIDAPREVAIRRGELAVRPPVSESSDPQRRACA